MLLDLEQLIPPNLRDLFKSGLIPISFLKPERMCRSCCCEDALPSQKLLLRHYLEIINWSYQYLN